MLQLNSLEDIYQNPQWNKKVGSLLQNTDSILNTLKDNNSPENVG